MISSSAVDTPAGMSSIISFCTIGAPGSGRWKPLRDVVVSFGTLLLPDGGSNRCCGGRLTVCGGGRSLRGGSGGSPRSGGGNSRLATNRPSAAPATPPTMYQMTLRFELSEGAGCVGCGCGGGWQANV